MRKVCAMMASGPGRERTEAAPGVEGRAAGAETSIWTCILHLTSSIGVLKCEALRVSTNTDCARGAIDRDAQEEAGDGARAAGCEGELREGERVCRCEAAQRAHGVLQLAVREEEGRVLDHGADDGRRETLRGIMALIGTLRAGSDATTRACGQILLLHRAAGACRTEDEGGGG